MVCFFSPGFAIAWRCLLVEVFECDARDCLFWWMAYCVCRLSFPGASGVGVVFRSCVFARSDMPLMVQHRWHGYLCVCNVRFAVQSFHCPIIGDQCKIRSWLQVLGSLLRLRLFWAVPAGAASSAGAAPSAAWLDGLRYNRQGRVLRQGHS